MKLIQEMDRAVRVTTDPVKLAIAETEGMNYFAQTSSYKDHDNDVERVLDFYRERQQLMNTNELRDAIGNDLEMLEYSPEEVESIVIRLMDELNRG